MPALEAERHLGQARVDAKAGEKSLEGGVGLVVQDDEARIHRQAGIGPGGDLDGVSVSAEIIVAFEKGDVAAVLKQVGAHKPGDTATDDCDPCRLFGQGLHSAIRSWGTRGKKHWCAACRLRTPGRPRTSLRAWGCPKP